MRRQDESILLFTLPIVLLCGLPITGCGGGGEAAGQSAALATGRGPVSTAQGTWIGDFDNDGRPGIGDGIAILRIVVGLASYNSLGDCNRDGRVGVDDAIKLLRCVVGLDEWPIGEIVAEPLPVTNVNAIGGQTSILVTWTPPQGTSLVIERYEIWRSVDGQLYLRLTDTVAPDAVSYTDSAMLDDRHTYQYKVRVWYTDGSHSTWEDSDTPVWFG